MSGRHVWEWPAIAVSYLVTSPRVLKSFPLQGALQPGEEEEVAGGQILWIKRVGNHRDALLGQEFPDAQDHVAWRIAVVQKTICEAISDELHLEGIVASNLCDCQTSVLTDYCIDMVNSLIGSCHWWPVWIIVDGRAAIFKSGIPLKCLGPIQCCFSECLL
jgi:hypothetical protein